MYVHVFNVMCMCNYIHYVYVCVHAYVYVFLPPVDVVGCRGVGGCVGWGYPHTIGGGREHETQDHVYVQVPQCTCICTCTCMRISIGQGISHVYAYVNYACILYTHIFDVFGCESYKLFACE